MNVEMRSDLYGPREPTSDATPWRWETGPQNHEAMAGVTAAVDYLAALGR